MGLFDSKKTKAVAEANVNLSQRVAELESMLTPEMRNYEQLTQLITKKRQELAAVEWELQQRQNQLLGLNRELQAAQAQLVQTNEEILFQSFGLYQPHYEFATSTDYKEKLTQIRSCQKNIIKNGYAVSGVSNWTVNGNAAAGKKMVADTQKLLLRAFNCECDDIVEHVRFNNIEAAEKRIRTSASAISKLGKIMEIEISPEYVPFT